MEKEIKVMIIDDEQEAIDLLKILLDETFPNVKIVATANGSAEAVETIFRKHPDLIFLDIKIDEKNGFDILKELEKENHKTHVVFVTAFNEFAVDAFKVNALDYLLKPVDPDDLKRVISKFKQQNREGDQIQSIQNLLKNYNPKIQFNTRNGYILIDPDEIVYCQSDGNYTELILKDLSKNVICSNLKKTQKQLPPIQFKRISRYHLINEYFLAEVNRSKQQCTLSVNGKKVVLSYSRLLFNGMFK